MAQVSFSIRIVNENGDPVVGEMVHIGYYRILQGWDEAGTDDDGWAEFTGPSHIGTVTVRGVQLNDADFSVEDGYTFSFTLSD